MEEKIEAILDKYIDNFRIKEGGKLSVNKALHDRTVQDIVNLFPIPDVSKSLAPYRCPICGGNGLVSGSFYTALFGCGGTSTNITQQCRTCNGAGILWG